MAKQTKLSQNKIIDISRDVVYASLGVQKTAYDFSVDQYTKFTKQRKKDIKAYIKRGEQLESQLRELYAELKQADNLVGKSVANVEQQVEKVVKLVVDLGDKVVASVPGRTAKKKAKRAPTARKTAAAKRRAPAKRPAPAKGKAQRKAA